MSNKDTHRRVKQHRTRINPGAGRDHDDVAVRGRRNDLVDQERTLQLHHWVVRILSQKEQLRDVGTTDSVQFNRRGVHTDEPFGPTVVTSVNTAIHHVDLCADSSNTA